MSKFGTTSSCIAFATEIAIQHNMKVLLVSTAFGDSLISESFWQEKKKKSFSLFGGSTKGKEVETSGIVGLDRMLRSNKLSPDIITDYAKIVLVFVALGAIIYLIHKLKVIVKHKKYLKNNIDFEENIVLIDNEICKIEFIGKLGLFTN